MTKNN